MHTAADLEAIHRFSSRHRDLLARSARAGCFHCGALFAPTEIEEWVTERRAGAGEPADRLTALCPHCGIDAVLPSAAPIELGAELLAEMKRHFFSDRER